MKTIPETDLKDAVTLSPLEMNDIHFDTGDRSNLLSDPVPQVSDTVRTVDIKTKQ